MKKKIIVGFSLCMLISWTATPSLATAVSTAQNGFPSNYQYEFDSWNMLAEPSDSLKSPNAAGPFNTGDWLNLRNREQLAKELFTKQLRFKCGRSAVERLIGPPALNCIVQADERGFNRVSAWYPIKNSACANAPQRMLELAYQDDRLVGYRFFVSHFGK